LSHKDCRQKQHGSSVCSTKHIDLLSEFYGTACIKAVPILLIFPHAIVIVQPVRYNQGSSVQEFQYLADRSTWSGGSDNDHVA